MSAVKVETRPGAVPSALAVSLAAERKVKTEEETAAATRVKARRSRSKSPPSAAAAASAAKPATRRSRSPIDLTGSDGDDAPKTPSAAAVKVERTPIRVIDIDDYKAENGTYEYETNVERYLKAGQVRVMCSIRFEEFDMASSILERLAATALKQLVPAARLIRTAPTDRDTCAVGTVSRVTPAAVAENPNALWKSWESVKEVDECCIAYSKYVRHCGFGGDKEHEAIGVIKQLNTADPNPVLITSKQHTGVVLFFPQLTVEQFQSSGPDESSDEETDDDT